MRIIEDNILFLNSDYPEELQDIVDKAQDLMISMFKLREKYKEANKLPLSTFKTDYENLINIMDCIESEFIKFGKPCKIRKEYMPYTSKELKEIMVNREELMDTGLDEWIEEGLLKKK